MLFGMPWNHQVKFGEPSAEPEEHNEALPATCSNTAQEQTMLGESFAVTIIIYWSFAYKHKCSCGFLFSHTIVNPKTIWDMVRHCTPAVFRGIWAGMLPPDVLVSAFGCWMIQLSGASASGCNAKRQKRISEVQIYFFVPGISWYILVLANNIK